MQARWASMKALQSTSALSEFMKHWSRFDLVSGQAQHLAGKQACE